MSRVTTTAQKPRAKAAAPRPASRKKPSSGAQPNSAPVDRFTPSTGPAGTLSLKRTDFLRVVRPSLASKPETADSRELLFEADNSRWQNLAKAEKDLKQLKNGTHPGLIERTKKAEEKRDQALRSLALGRQERKSQIARQRSKVELESAQLESDLRSYFPARRQDISGHRNAGTEAQIALRRSGDTGKKAERALERVNQLDARLASEHLSPSQRERYIAQREQEVESFKTLGLTYPSADDLKRFRAEGAPKGETAQDILSRAAHHKTQARRLKKDLDTTWARKGDYKREKTAEFQTKLDELKAQEADIDRTYFRLQGQYVGQARQEIKDARAGLEASLERRTSEKARTFQASELSGNLRNAAALQGVPDDAQALLRNGQLEFTNKMGQKVTVSTSEGQVTAHTDQRHESFDGRKLPGDVVTSTLDKDGTLTDQTTSYAQTYGPEKRAYIKQERLQTTSPDGRIDRTIKDYKLPFGAQESRLESIIETKLDRAGNGTEVVRKPDGKEVRTYHLEQNKVVAKTAPFPSESSLQAQAERVVSDSLVQIPDKKGRSRHDTNALVQSQPVGGKEPWRTHAHYDGSPVVVIAFEGTGSFDERRPKLMQEMGRRLQEQGVDTTSDKFSPAPLLDRALEKERGRGANWSGLSSGPLTEVVKDPKLNNSVQWLSFPSEEVEAFSSPEAYKDLELKQYVRDYRLSSRGTSRGIDAAVERMREIAQSAKYQGKSPKFVLLSHSSGGRSSVKFAERMKGEVNPATGKPYEFALAVSIDPVREAHEAVGEIALDKINIFDSERATVNSRRQPESLFKTSNVETWLNYYQTSDTKGLDMGFGIHGSPIVGAENHHLEGFDNPNNAHGPVAYHNDVLERFKKEMHALIP